MAISMYSASIPVFVRQLTAIDNCIVKAENFCEGRKINSRVLARARLYPDMFPLIEQVQQATENAVNGTARLARVQPPKLENNERSLSDVRARIARALDFLKGIRPEQLDGSDDRDVNMTIRNRERTFKGDGYLMHFILPNFYFHCSTTYAILRHNGVDIGKRDFLNNRRPQDQ